MRPFLLPGDEPKFGQHVEIFKFMQIGTIIRVDNELNLVDITFDSNMGTSTNVPITSPFYTGRAFIGGMPEVGSQVVCGFVKNTNNIGFPIIVSYFNPFYLKSIQYSYDRGKAPNDLKSLESIKDKIGYNVTRLKRRKLYPGDINLESSQGAELVLDHDVMLADANLNEISISSTDNSIISSSVINKIFTSGVKLTSGIIERSDVALMDSLVLADGDEQTIITDNLNSIDKNGQPFSEFKLVVNEVSYGTLMGSRIDQDPSTIEDIPLVTQTFGTVVGDRKSDMERYGRVLKPQIFTSAIEAIVNSQDLICIPSEYTTIASAYQLNFKSGTKIDIDKEGHTFVKLSASSGRHALGAGRSLEMATDGSIKLVVGRNANQQRSIDLDTTGACSINIGNDDRNLKSIDLITSRSIYVTVKAPDRLGYALKESYKGNVLRDVRGNQEITVSGNYTITVQGKIQENILGTKVENYINDKLTNYGGSFSEILIGTRKSVIGGLGSSGTVFGVDTTIATGGSSLTATLGSVKETLLKGDRTTSVLVGNIEETIGIGDKTIKITTGNFDVNITAGKVTITNNLGTIEISMAGTIDITSNIKVNVNAPLVDLGSSPVKGGIVTNLTHPVDYVTGLPILGSLTIKASS